MPRITYKLNHKTIDKICELRRLRKNWREISIIMNIHENSLLLWRKRGEAAEYGIYYEFVQALEQAEAKFYKKPKLKQRTRRGVYFLQGEVTRRIKIGFSTDLDSRVKQLYMVCSEHLELLHFIEGGTLDEEKHLHNKFSEFNVKGEWFEPSDELLNYIAEIRQPQQLFLDIPLEASRESAEKTEI